MNPFPIVIATLVAIAIMACTVATTPTITPDARYAAETLSLVSELRTKMQHFFELISMPQLDEDGWHAETQSTVADVESMSARISSVTPPGGFEGFHNSLSLAAEHYARAGQSVPTQSNQTLVPYTVWYPAAILEMKLGNTQMEKAQEFIEAFVRDNQ